MLVCATALMAAARVQRPAGPGAAHAADHARRLLSAAARRSRTQDRARAVRHRHRKAAPAVTLPRRPVPGAPGIHRRPHDRRRPWAVSTALARRAAGGRTRPAASSGPATPTPRRTAPQCRPTELLVPPCGAWFGAYVRHSKPDLEEKVLAYEKRIGRKLDIVYTYHDMSRSKAAAWRDSCSPRRSSASPARSGCCCCPGRASGGAARRRSSPRWKQIAAAALDATRHRRPGRADQGVGKQVFLSFDLEMDTRTPANGTPAEYVAAYRHIHDRFRELGVTNVVWTWTITGYLDHSRPDRAHVPGRRRTSTGSAYNQYNYYRCHKADWLSFAQTQTATHDWIRENISADKPLMLSEFGTADDPSQSGRAGRVVRAGAEGGEGTGRRQGRAPVELPRPGPALRPRAGQATSPGRACARRYPTRTSTSRGPDEPGRPAAPGRASRARSRRWSAADPATAGRSSAVLVAGGPDRRETGGNRSSRTPVTLVRQDAPRSRPRHRIRRRLPGSPRRMEWGAPGAAAAPRGSVARRAVCGSPTSPRRRSPRR